MFTRIWPRPIVRRIQRSWLIDLISASSSMEGHEHLKEAETSQRFYVITSYCMPLTFKPGKNSRISHWSSLKYTFWWSFWNSVKVDKWLLKYFWTLYKILWSFLWFLLKILKVYWSLLISTVVFLNSLNSSLKFDEWFQDAFQKPSNV